MNTDVAQKLEELTYERQDLCDFDPIWETVEQNCPLAQPSSIAGSNTASLQALRQSDLLPLEILQNILQLLDLHTVTLMLSISHRSKLLVDSLPQHRNHHPRSQCLTRNSQYWIGARFHYRPSIQSLARSRLFRVRLIRCLPTPSKLPPVLLAMCY